MSAEYSYADGDADASSLIYLSEPLPSSVKPLGLSLATSPLTTTAATPAAAPSASPSFRVRAMHLDDVAEDVILVCEDSITLCVPLTWSAAAAATAGLEGPSKSEKDSIEAPHGDAARLAQDAASPTAINYRNCPPHARGTRLCLPSPHAPPAPQSSTPTANAEAAAACLRMANPSQVWMSPLSASCCTTASTSGLCLPRRLPMPPEELRRSASVLMAVPLPPPAALWPSASSADRHETPGLTAGPLTVSGYGTLTAPPPVMAVYIMECPVLPEGVDYIAASAVPLARPLAKFVCSPNTLRFREAWYPVQFFCWCDSDNAPAAASSTSAAAYVDHHLLCASSIAVDLIQVRCRANPALAPQPPQPPQASMKPSALLSCGGSGTHEDGHIERETVRILPVSPLSAATAASMTPSSCMASSATTGGVCDEAAMVSIRVLQRYVTRSDWCTYDARSRVLLSLNHARPSVVKPIKVYVGRKASSVDSEPRAKSSRAAEASSAPLELRTLTELTLPESLCATLHMDCTGGHGTAAASLPELLLPLLRCPQASQQLSSLLGVLTIYGQSFVYHVSSGRGTVGGRQDPMMSLYMHVPYKEHGCQPLPGMSQTERALSSGVAGAGASASVAEAAHSDSLLSRLTAAASFATASAPPPKVCGGFFVHAVRLSLTAVISHPSRDFQASMQDLLPDAVGADALGAPLPQPPRSVPFCVQVVDNLIVIHSPDTARSAVYDLADCGGGSVSRMGAATASRNVRRSTPARSHVWKAVNSDPVGAGVRAHKPTTASAANNAADSAHYSSEPDPSLGAGGGATSASHGVANSGFGRFQFSWPHHRSDSSITDDVDDASAATSRSLLLPSPTAPHPPTAASSAAQAATADSLAGEHQQQRDRSHRRKVGLEHQAPSADFRSMLSVLSSSMLAMSASDPTTTAAAAASAVPLMYPLYCCGAAAAVEGSEEGGAGSSGDAPRASEPIVYSDYQWLGGPRLPLVMKASDGTLRVCRVDAARVAVWRLLVDFSRESNHAGQDPSSLQQEQGLDVNALNGEAAAGLVRSYVSFLCRRHQVFPARSANGRSTSSTHALVGLLGELTGQAVGLEGDDGDCNGVGVSQTDPAEYSKVDALRHLLCMATTSTPVVAGKQLYALWTCMLENLTLETAFSARCVAVERERSLALAGGVGGADVARAASSEASGGLLISSAELQQLILQKVFAPTWAALQSSLPCHPQQQQQPQRRRQLEGLLCDYVRLLHSAAIPVEPPLQHLLLEIVLCDVGDTLASPFVSSQSPSVCSAARRVQELLRQGVLERNEATARWLLDWWTAYQEVSASVRRSDAADARARRLNAGEPSAERRAESSGAAASAPTSLTAATPMAQQSADVSFSPFCPGDDAEETEILFEEAVRLLEARGFLLEVAEAYICRSHFTAAAAVLQRVPQQSKLAEVPVVAPSPALSHRRQTRVLSWDSLALSVLDGAWRCVRWAEEALFSNAGGAPVASQHQLAAADFASNPLRSWRMRSLERQVQAAHRVYVTVAKRLLVKPTARALLPSRAMEAADSGQGSLAAPTSPNVDGRFHVHEVRHEQLLRQMEQGWHELKQRGGA
ncbi:conserved hypothetical protein [Leishmania mexicana MHOM/GT/2001/U1103]|uniref:Uncharacterized protein n=1 Tax=Leishmania mexicana (strain MHOM/GT/2001/U1103) TaxID=929439 RepID=E9AR14_LEIMU|nr:conserved hypothetical protein [Leishmania mexicana MHOM/GT/2001/U1103]CBZ25401.1 conserved hypothetical protein [Leishmania mexicana MHOM/GT/2001/U1103]